MKKKTMQALVLRARGFEHLSMEEVPIPSPGPRQLLARVDAAGVCTSIIKLVEQAEDHKYLSGWDPSKWPLIMGDEGALTIVEAGSELREHYPAGTRVGVQPSVDVGPINHRERYRDNARGITKTAVGYTLGGHLAEYMLIPEEVIEGNCVVPLPDPKIPAFAVSMCEPISCVVSAQTRQVHIWKPDPTSPREARLGIKPGGVCVVVGAGAMGKIHVELAMRYRPSALVVVDTLETNLAWVRQKLGAKAQARGINLATATPDAAGSSIEAASAGRMADDIIVAVGIRSVQNQAIDWLGFGGVINLFGGLKRGDSMLTIDNIRVHYDEIKIVGSSGGDPHDYIETLNAIVDGDIEPGRYVAAVGSLENAPAVLEMIKAGEISGKAILYPQIRPTPLRMVESWSAEEERRFLAERS